MSAVLRTVLATAQLLLCIAWLGAAFDHHDFVLAREPNVVDGAIDALIAVACFASAFILVFGDIAR